MLNKKEPNNLVVARNGSPLIIGLGEKINYVASDIQALIQHTNKFVYLEDGDIATLSSDEVKIYDSNKKNIRRETKKSNLSLKSNSKRVMNILCMKYLSSQMQ